MPATSPKLVAEAAQIFYFAFGLCRLRQGERQTTACHGLTGCDGIKMALREIGPPTIWLENRFEAGQSVCSEILAKRFKFMV